MNVYGISSTSAQPITVREAISFTDKSVTFKTSGRRQARRSTYGEWFKTYEEAKVALEKIIAHKVEMLRRWEELGRELRDGLGAE